MRYPYKLLHQKSPISYLDKLEDLDISYQSISDISFLKNNENVKKLNLSRCKEIQDYSPISYLEKLDDLNIRCVDIFDVSFLKIKKILKNLI